MSKFGDIARHDTEMSETYPVMVIADQSNESPVVFWLNETQGVIDWWPTDAWSHWEVIKHVEDVE
jgi:hypothetical protein